ncbi:MULTISPECIES: nitroreductase family protein [unclassified Clostridioides]|uniref:nitroreductase family protein n=1 Tax=unclassified Clostridioides TaxID=2635829 RepID=UPI001D10928D|nr:nitroreductase family protein [Clostridioides sp. ES-S-0049-02]MCC0708026.1 nitroreductase family protein [Clostridioides sp. ES-S-0190-01]
MNFVEIAKKRYSCRNYQDKKVEKEKLEKILEVARVAPTGGNRQPQRLIVIQEKEGLNKVSKAANIYDAPLAIIVCGDKYKAWTRPFDGKQLTDIDTSIVTDHMMLQATELGLASVWVCYFNPDVIREEFNLSDNIEPVNILLIGYEVGTPESPNRHDKTRLPLNEIVSYETL